MSKELRGEGKTKKRIVSELKELEFGKKGRKRSKKINIIKRKTTSIIFEGHLSSIRIGLLPTQFTSISSEVNLRHRRGEEEQGDSHEEKKKISSIDSPSLSLSYERHRSYQTYELIHENLSPSRLLLSTSLCVRTSWTKVLKIRIYIHDSRYACVFF